VHDVRRASFRLDEDNARLMPSADAPRAPAPDGILSCLQELDVTGRDTVFVGNSTADIIAATRGNLQVIAVRSELIDSVAITGEHPTAVIDHLSELVDTIGALPDPREPTDSGATLRPDDAGSLTPLR
jgi:phosphoglycolate phosphatase-like HAD superfamily hydrolase